jgi:hypothetical protein
LPQRGAPRTSSFPARLGDYFATVNTVSKGFAVSHRILPLLPTSVAWN